MAIISGMEAAKVGDVTPFELPIEKMAKGIEAVQKRADSAREMYGIGQAAMNFKVRDRKEDYDERARLAKEFDDNIQKELSAVGGDWSKLNNSIIQAQATKSARNPFVSHLIDANKRADVTEKEVRRIEGLGGFAELFGSDARTQDLYEKDGSFRDLSKNSVQPKISHEEAADAYFDHAGEDFIEEILWSYSGDLITDPKVREEIGTGFFRKDWTKLKQNNRQIAVVINNMVDDFIEERAGKQYYEKLIERAKQSGLGEKEAVAYARGRAERLLQVAGAKRSFQQVEKRSDMQYNPQKPVAVGSGNNGPAGPTETKTITPKEKKPSMLEGDFATMIRTNEGLQTPYTTYAQGYHNITSDNYSLNGLSANFKLAELTNVKQMGGAILMTPTTIAGTPGAGKNIDGYAYTASQNFGSANRAYGNNPTCVRTLNYADPRYGNWGNMLGAPPLDQVLKQYDGTADDGYGKPICSDYDLQRAYRKIVSDNFDKTKRKFNSPAERKKAVDAEADGMLLAYRNGSITSQMGSLYDAEWNEDKGYNTFKIKPEFQLMLDIVEADIAKELADNPPNEAILKILRQKKINISEKITEGIEVANMMNTPASDLFSTNPEYLNDPSKMSFIKSMEISRNQTKTLMAQANHLLTMDWLIAREKGVTYEDWKALTNPSKSDPNTVYKMEKSKQAYNKIIAASVEEANSLGSYGVSTLDFFLQESYDTKNAKTIRASENVVNLMYDVQRGVVVDGINKVVKKPGAQIYYTKVNNRNETVKANTHEDVSKLSIFALEQAGYTKNSYGNYEVDYRTYNMISRTEYFFKNKCQADGEGNIIRNSGRFIDANTNFDKAYRTASLRVTGGTPAATAYFKAQADAKIEHLGTARVFNFNITSTDGKAMYDRVKNTALQQYNANAGSDNPTGMGVLKRVNYGGLDKDGKQQNVTEEDINKQGDLMKQIILHDKIARGDKAGERSIGAILADISQQPGMGFIGISPDHNNDENIFNAIFAVPYTDANGNVGVLNLELEMPPMSTEVLEALGISSYWTEFNQEIIASRKASGNTSVTITLPSTKGSANPQTNKYYEIHVPMTIQTVNGSVTAEAGSFILFENGDSSKSFHDQLLSQNKPGGVSVRHFASIEAICVDFEKTYMQSDAALIEVMKDIDARGKQILKVVNNSKMTPAQIENYVKEYHGALWDGLTDGGKNPNITQQSIDALKGKFFKTHKKQYASDNAKEVFTLNTSTNNGGSQIDKVFKIITKTNNDSDWSLQAGTSNTGSVEVTQKDLLDMTDDDLILLLSYKGLKNSASLIALGKQLKEGKYTKDANGKRFMNPNGVDYSKMQIANSDVNKTFSLPKGRLGYQFITNPAYDTQLKNKPLVVAKTDVPNRANPKLVTAFTSLPVIPTLSGPIQVSSGHRSIEDNIHAYKGNMKALTRSEHLEGNAIDISTTALKSEPNQYNGSGYEFLYWLGTADGKKWLKDNSLYAWHHTVDKVSEGDANHGWHIHLEYTTNAGKIGVLRDDEAPVRNEVISRVTQVPQKN